MGLYILVIFTLLSLPFRHVLASPRLTVEPGMSVGRRVGRAVLVCALCLALLVLASVVTAIVVGVQNSHG